MGWDNILLKFSLETTFSYLDCQLFLNIFAGFTHSKLVECEGKHSKMSTTVILPLKWPLNIQMLLQLVGSKTHPVATDYRGWMDVILHKIIASLKQNSVSVSKNWLGNWQEWEKEKGKHLLPSATLLLWWQLKLFHLLLNSLFHRFNASHWTRQSHVHSDHNWGECDLTIVPCILGNVNLAIIIPWMQSS